MDSRDAATTDTEHDVTRDGSSGSELTPTTIAAKCQSVPFALREIMGTALTKIFWSGFFWQLFSFAAAGPTYWTFALASGFGDAVGVFFGNLVRIGMESLASAPSASAPGRCANAMLRIIFTPAPFPGKYNSLMD